MGNQTFVDGVELLDQALDAGVVERQALDVADDFVAQLIASRHTAPIRQTCRSCQAANARRDSGFAAPTFAESGSRGSCALLRAVELLARQLHLNPLILQLTQPLVRGGNVVEGLEHLRLELGLHGGEREGILILILVVESACNAAVAAIPGAA